MSYKRILKFAESHSNQQTKRHKLDNECMHEACLKNKFQLQIAIFIFHCVHCMHCMPTSFAQHHSHGNIPSVGKLPFCNTSDIFSLSLSLSFSFYFYLFLSRTRTLSLSHTHTYYLLFLSLSFSFSLALSLSLKHIHIEYENKHTRH